MAQRYEFRVGRRRLYTDGNHDHDVLLFTEYMSSIYVAGFLCMRALNGSATPASTSSAFRLCITSCSDCTHAVEQCRHTVSNAAYTIAPYLFVPLSCWAVYNCALTLACLTELYYTVTLEEIATRTLTSSRRVESLSIY